MHCHCGLWVVWVVWGFPTVDEAFGSACVLLFSRLLPPATCLSQSLGPTQDKLALLALSRWQDGDIQGLFPRIRYVLLFFGWHASALRLSASTHCPGFRKARGKHASACCAKIGQNKSLCLQSTWPHPLREKMYFVR